MRTTRQLRLSSAGEKCLPQCEQALQMLELARNNIQKDQDSVEGSGVLSALVEKGVLH